MVFASSPVPATEPPPDCRLCPRLAAERDALRRAQPAWWNAPVPVLGDAAAWLAIVGLAPGRHGANRTGRAFTGDDAGALLFATLARHGLAAGEDAANALHGVVIVNAVRCWPPENRPTPEEVRTCRRFLAAPLAALERVRVVVALGQLAHQSVVKALGGRLPKARFAHGAEHRLPDGRALIDSYHCSRYNQNTGRLSPAMLDAVFARALELRGAEGRAAVAILPHAG